MLSPSISRRVSVTLLLATLFVFAKNFWLNEDAYIIFRSLEQLQVGHGAVWNTGERVQVYTSVAWYWLLAAVNAVIGNVFLTTIGVTITLFVALMVLARRLYGDNTALWFVLIAMLLSKGFFDYTSSGLENILAYVVLLALYAAYHATSVGDHNEVRWHYLIAALTGLLPLVRHDLALLGFLPFTLLLWQQRKHWRHAAIMTSTAIAPLALWTLASLVYYGLPLPNTAYAKLNHGFDKSIILQSGVDYFYWNARLDPVTLFTVAIAIPVTFIFLRRNWQRGFALGNALYCFYLYRSGGDYMAGRFLSFPFLLAVLLIAESLRGTQLKWATLLPAALVITFYLGLIPATPPATPWTYGRNADAKSLIAQSRTRNALDQRQLHYQTTLAAWWLQQQRAPGILEALRKDGETLRKSGETITVRGAVGITGYYAGLNIHIVDFLALTDPFLAQLPATERLVSGHFEREIVPGYIDHLRDHSTPLPDADLNEYCNVIQLLTREPQLFSVLRLKTIVAFNIGRFDNLLLNYRENIHSRVSTISQQESDRHDDKRITH